MSQGSFDAMLEMFFLRKKGRKIWNRTEIGIDNLLNVEKAIEYENERQTKVLESQRRDNSRDKTI